MDIEYLNFGDAVPKRQIDGFRRQLVLPDDFPDLHHKPGPNGG